MRPATRACRSFGLAHAIISRRLQSFVNSKNWAVPVIQILASGVLLTEHLNFEMFSIFKLGQADPIDIPARRSSHAGAPCAGRAVRNRKEQSIGSRFVNRATLAADWSVARHGTRPPRCPLAQGGAVLREEGCSGG